MARPRWRQIRAAAIRTDMSSRSPSGAIGSVRHPSPGTCSWSAATLTKRAGISEVGRAQSRRSPVPTTSPSIQLETCGSRPMAHPVQSLKPTACSGCRLRAPSAVVLCSSWPCRTRPKPAARLSMIVTDQSLSRCSIQVRRDRGTTNCPTFPTIVPAGAKPRPGVWRGPRPSVVQVTRGG